MTQGAVGGVGRPGAAGWPYPLRGAAVTVPPRRPDDLVAQFRAMASDVTLRVVDPGSGAATLLERARTLFEDVERACTRFDPQSPLMRANASPESWHDVPPELYQAIGAAAEAYRLTAGRFDPRVLRALQGLGYDRSLPFAAGGVRTADHSAAPAAGTPWAPGLDPERSAVRLGPEPVDLGGIGKGLAVDRAADLLAAAGRAVLVEAGGDCRLVGAGPEDTGWRIGVEDPFGGASPLAVLSLANLGCATSSIRLRQWTAGGRRVHHLIDPRTGQPGGHGLQAVTVAAPATAMAEVWSKVLFLAGSAGVADLARAQGLAALWVTDDGSVGTTRAMDELVVWRGDHDG